MLSLGDLRFRFDTIRHKERRAILAIGFSRGLMMLVAFVLLYFLFDRFFDPPLLGRWAVVLAGLGGVGWIVYVGVFARLRRISDDDEIALRIEECHPELHGRLLSFVQLARARDQRSLLASPVLMRALEEETLNAVARLNFLEIVPRELARISLLAAGFAIVVQVTCLLMLPLHFVALAERLVDATAPFPTRTRIEAVECPEWVALGGPCEVLVRVDRNARMPEQPGTLVFRDLSDGTQIRIELAADPAGEGLYRGSLSRVVSDLEIVAYLGDAHSTPCVTRVVTRPEVKSGRVMYRWPDYLKRKDIREQALGSLDLLQGGSMGLVLESTEPLAEAMLVERYGESRALISMDDRGLQWRLRDPVRVVRHTSFHIRMRDRHGITNALPAVEYPVVARPDQPPEVVLQYPSRDLSVTPEARLGLRFQVSDDFGVRSVWLAFRVEGEGQRDVKPQRIPLTQLAKDDEGRILLEQQLLWHLARQQFQAGDRIIFWIEADDDCPTNDVPTDTKGQEPADHSPVYSSSAEIRLSVVTSEEKTLELQTRIARLSEDLNALKSEQEDIRNRVHELLRRLGAITP